jgi:7 transmembrane receptor (rhodopsin family)
VPDDFYQCLCLSSFVTFVYAATISSRVVVSADRFWAIGFPFSYHGRTARTVTLVVVLSWILPMVPGALLALNPNKENFNGVCKLTSLMVLESTVFDLVYFCVHCLAMVVLYIAVFFMVRKLVRFVATWQP